MTNVIRFAIVGTGGMAASMMQAFALMPHLKVVAVMSASEDRAAGFAQRFGIPGWHHSLDSLLAGGELDAVYIANATEKHFSTTMAVLGSGRSVLCEKPIAVSAAESRLIELEAKRVNALCMEAMWTHCLPAYRQLFSHRQSADVGEVTHLYADFGYPVDPVAQPRFFRPSEGSGVLLDRGVYPVALAVRLFGNVKSLAAHLNYSDTGVDTHADLMLLHEGTQRSVLSVSFDTLLQNRAVLSGTRGLVGLEPPVIGSEALLTNRSHAPGASVAETGRGANPGIKQWLKQSSLLRRLNGRRSSGLIQHCSYGANQYVPMLEHFADLMSAGLKESPIHPLSLSTEVLRVIDLVKMQVGKSRC